MQKYRPYLIPAACLCAFFLLAVWNIYFPGLNYDEVLFANGAWGNLDHSFVTKTLFGFPLYSMPYLGAVQVWIYWIVFHLVGASVWSIRLPMVLGAMLGLAGYFFVARKHFNERTAWMATSLLVANAVFVWATRQGYSGIEFVLQVFSTIALLGGMPAWILTSLLLCGVFYKISFFWWASGVAIGGFIAFPEQRKSMLVSAASLFAFLLWWRWYVNFSVGHELVSDFHQRWVDASNILANLMDGLSTYKYFYRDFQSPGYFGMIWTRAILLGGVAAVLVWPRDRNLKFVVVATICTLVFTFFGARATAYWHFLPLLPFLLLIWAALLARMKALGLLLWAVCLLQLVHTHYQLAQNTRYEPRDHHWTTAIYPLISWCQEGERKCSSLEWGTHNQLLAFIPDAKRVTVFPEAASLNSDTYYISYFQMPLTSERLRFLDLAEKSGWDASVEKEISANGEIIFSLYRLKRLAR